MPNFLARGQDFLNRTLSAAAGVAVTYERPGRFAVALTARPGDEAATATPAPPTQKPRREDAERDYLIDVADLLTPDGVAFTPRKGDRVAETVNGVACVFEVTPREAEPAWRYSDPQRTAVRVHTKRVA